MKQSPDNIPMWLIILLIFSVFVGTVALWVWLGLKVLEAMP